MRCDHIFRKVAFPAFLPVFLAAAVLFLTGCSTRRAEPETNARAEDKKLQIGLSFDFIW